MRKKLLLGNWKMNLTIAEATAFAIASIPLVEKAKAANVLIGIAPTYLSLATVKQHNPDLIVSAQNIHFESSGAFTGEISTSMVKELGVNWTLIGHSERRSYFAETNLICNKKMIKASQEGFTSVYCVGESSDDYDHGRTKAVIRDQLLIGLAGLSSEQMQKVVIAYEPVWSIGTGKNASKEHAQDIANYIRERLEDMFNPLLAQATLILYGGSVKPSNIKDYLTQPDVDGALVGGSSLKVSSIEELLTNMIG
jgi:triosephosphate isomerase